MKGAGRACMHLRAFLSISFLPGTGDGGACFVLCVLSFFSREMGRKGARLGGTGGGIFLVLFSRGYVFVVVGVFFDLLFCVVLCFACLLPLRSFFLDLLVVG